MPVYNSKTIKETVKNISQLHLPAIQREFVWNKSKIESLFDSILSSYPIGTFIYWEVDAADINTYTFYEFIKDYHEKTSKNPKTANPHIQDTLIGVLDGQQRLTSMYVALQGTYTYRPKSARSAARDKKCELYLNLLYDKTNEDAPTYEFKFLTIEEAKEKDETHLWFKVNTVLTWDEQNYVTNAATYAATHLTDANKIGTITPVLIKLYTCLCKDELINYFTVKGYPLDSVADIFQRVNANGKPLSKSDLLFSTIIANWTNARDEVDKLLNILNNIGDGFNFDKDFIMRACLFVTDLPTRQIVANFTKNNVRKIIASWTGIETSLIETTNLLSSFGLNKENLTSYNAIMPIIYYKHFGGDLKANSSELKKYIVSALAVQLVSGAPDTILAQLRKVMEKFKAVPATATTNATPVKSFDFNFFASEYKKESGGTEIKIDKKRLEDIIDNNTKGAITFMLLSLLYPNLLYKNVKFHQDHIHPAAGFTERNIRVAIPTIAPTKITEWLEKKDRLPNLQLLEGLANQHKQDTSYTIWLAEEAAKGVNIPNYKKDNYIDLALSENLADFDIFYDTRRANLITELLKLL